LAALETFKYSLYFRFRGVRVLGKPKTAKYVNGRLEVNLSKAAELFLNFKERELSPRTVKEYGNDINLFIKTVGDKPVSEVKTADLMLFRSSLTCSPSLINRRISALNSFFNFLVDMELLTKNPVKPSLRIKKVKQTESSRSPNQRRG